MLADVDLRRADLLGDRDPLRARGGHRRRAGPPARRAPPPVPLAGANGVALGSTGTHPLSDYREQHIIDTEHYRRVEDGLKYVAWRNNTFSLHVHVGVQGADRAVRVCDRLRPVLPLLLAGRANSPYVDGRDSGLHSARTQTFTKSFPRCGVPDVFGSWAAWEEYVDLLMRTNSIVEFTQLWWSVRPHHTFGTVEVRICDAQTTGPEADALVELIVACVAQAPREVDAGETPPDLPGRLIEENMWRAIRYGLDGRLLDLEARASRSTRPPRRWTGCGRGPAPTSRFPSSTAPSASDARSTPVPARRGVTRGVEETRATYTAQEEVERSQPPPRAHRGGARRRWRPRWSGSRSTTCSCRRSSP